MNADLKRLTEIDAFNSGIWTERNRGNDDFQLSVPANPDTIRALAIGTRVGLIGSKVPMMVDKQTVKSKLLTVVGTSLTQHLNDRFVRYSANQADTNTVQIDKAGAMIQQLVQDMAIDGPYLDGLAGYEIGIANPQILKIPNLSIGSYDTSGPTITVLVPYGPLYDAIKAIADTYEINMRIERIGQALVFRNWVGVDHTSSSSNALVRFSPDLDNFGNTTEVVDGSKFKTHAWVFTPSFPTGTVTGVGADDGNYTGFDLRAELVLASDISQNNNRPQTALNNRAAAELYKSRIVTAVDGELAATTQFKYGVHYNLGDIVEAQGETGVLQASRVTEYIRSQDASGAKAYPTLVAV